MPVPSAVATAIVHGIQAGIKVRPARPLMHPAHSTASTNADTNTAIFTLRALFLLLIMMIL